MLWRACRGHPDECAQRITADREHCRKLVEDSVGLVTALNPLLAYKSCAAIGKEGIGTNRWVHELVLQSGLFTGEKIDEVLSPAKMMRPRYVR